MVKKRSIRAALSLLLLICFSVVALPLDFLHNHSEEEVQCSDFGKQGTCSHKLHISKKGNFCFACAIHFDKNFVNTNNEVKEAEAPWIRIFLEHKVTAIVIEPLLTLLRGPPSE